MANLGVDMSGRSVMVTGFTAGLGNAAAKSLAEMGADLSLVCRNAQKGKEVIESIRNATGNTSLQMFVGDMGSQNDIRRVADEFLSTGKPLHVLFNNAGVVNTSRTTTEDGLETTFAVNHLGYFLLTNLLLERLRAAASARVVCTASDAHKFGGGALNFEDLQSEQKYTTFGAYGQSKLANILFTRELARREADADITANSFHPGFVGSDFSKNNGAVARVLMTLGKPFARSIEKGAETGIYLCAAPEVADTTGGYFKDRKPHTPSSHAQNDDHARQLWEVSSKLTGLGG